MDTYTKHLTVVEWFGVSCSYGAPNGTLVILFSKFIFVWTKINFVEQKRVQVNKIDHESQKSILSHKIIFQQTKFTFVMTKFTFVDNGSLCTPKRNLASLV